MVDAPSIAPAPRTRLYLAITAVLAAMAGMTLYDADGLYAGVAYSAISPGDFPRLIAFGQIGLAAAFAMAAFRGTTEPAPRLHIGPGLLVLCGLVLQIIALPHIGFTVSAAFVFAFTALAFGQRRFLLSFAIGLGLALLFYTAFTKGLGLTLPKGLFEKTVGLG